MDRSELQRLLLEKDWKRLREKVVEDQGIVRQLMSRIYVNDGLLFWRAVDALGIAVQMIEAGKAGYAAETVRRYFWSLNEESGGTAWNAAEAIGSILAHCPDQCGHFNWMFSGLLDDESLNEGTLWGLAQLACVAPEHVFPLVEVVLPFLESANPKLRGLAALIQAILPGWQEKIPGDLQKKCQGDEQKVELYFNHQLRVYTMADLFAPQLITYWQETMETDQGIWPITVASTSQGLFWVGLGAAEGQENQLQAYCRRWCPHAFLIKRKEPNARVLEQIHEYLLGQRSEFNLPLHVYGTPFQRRVWEELLKIPYGLTCSYYDIAQRIGHPKGQRAVGMANHHNPIGIVVPCHRVIGKNGHLTGYAGGIPLKNQLLKLEQYYAPKG